MLKFLSLFLLFTFLVEVLPEEFTVFVTALGVVCLYSTLIENAMRRHHVHKND